MCRRKGRGGRGGKGGEGRLGSRGRKRELTAKEVRGKGMKGRNH